MIVSFIHGRVRLRFKEQKECTIAENVKAKVKETGGKTKVEINTRTGSILIEYDPIVLSTEKFIEVGRQELTNLNIKLGS